MRRYLIVFAKEPEKGKVKTRLKERFSENQLLNLYKAFLQDTIELAEKVDCEERIIAYETNKKVPRYLRKTAPAFRLYRQKGKGLGIRMHNAFEFAGQEGALKTVIIGSDAPTLPPKYINAAFRQLEQAEVVLGPTSDGGYYLIGLKKPCIGLFEDVRWSSKTAFVDTLKNINKIKKTLAILDYWYDVDDSDALMRLGKDLKKLKSKDAARWTKLFWKERRLWDVIMMR